jgi:hypothetical protein
MCESRKGKLRELMEIGGQVSRLAHHDWRVMCNSDGQCDAEP